MNGYSELLRYFKLIGQPLVNTMTQGEFSDIDLDKKNIFPLLHVAIGDASFPSDGVIRFSVQLGCFDIRDINKDVNDDKYYDNDNDIDNLNSTLAVLNRVWLLMLKDFEENNITASESPSLQQFTESRKNFLDGWIMTFDVEVPNTIINLCQ
jgi:hypothetical protein